MSHKRKISQKNSINDTKGTGKRFLKIRKLKCNDVNNI